MALGDCAPLPKLPHSKLSWLGRVYFVKGMNWNIFGGISSYSIISGIFQHIHYTYEMLINIINVLDLHDVCFMWNGAPYYILAWVPIS